MSFYDAIVLGGGPAGITASLYLARAGCSVFMAEALTPGGQVLQTERIENYPGFPKGITGFELSDNFSAHLTDLSVKVVSATATELDSSPAMQRVKIDGQWIEGRVLIICTGSHHKHLNIERENEFNGRGISYCALCDGNFFRNQTIAVVGGGNTALEESLYLSRLVKKIYLIHRRCEFRGAKIYQNKIDALGDKIEVLGEMVVSSLHGEKDLAGISIRHVTTGEERRLDDVQGLFIFVGFNPNGEFLPDSINRDSGGFIITDTEMRTSLPGVFAAGDIRSKLCRQIATAVGDGATAAQAAFLYLENLDV